MVHLLVGATIVSAGHDIDHAVVFTFLEWRVNTDVMTVGHQALINLFFLDLRCIRQLCQRRFTLIFLLELIDFAVDFIE